MQRLNSLLSGWPNGVIYTTSWLNKQGITNSLSKHYCDKKWIVSKGRGAFAKFGDNVDWQGGLWAIQEQLGKNIHVGAKTALLILGYGHYLPFGQETVTLFGLRDVALPSWFKEYNKNIKIKYFTPNLFGKTPLIGLTKRDYGSFSIKISSAERAILEVLYLIPHEQPFEESCLLMEGLTTLRPAIVQQLLESCTSFKIKRLFMSMSEYLNLPVVDSLNMDLIDLGLGKSEIGKGGKINHKYQIIIPFPVEEDEYKFL
jgi:hypothetical protein